MDEHLESNRALWDEWAEINARSGLYDLEGFKQGGLRLRDYEVEEVGPVGGKTLLHLQCHFGIDSLSWARLGAKVTGIDFSDRAVELATGLAAELGLDASFIRSDLYELPEHLDGEFDVVYTSRGALCWLPRIRPWADVVAHFVRPGGFLYVTEAHPILWAYEDDFTLKFPYWEHDQPVAIDVKGSYADPTAEVTTEKEYSWNHGLGEIVTALAEAGLRIEFLHEWPFVDWELPFLEKHDGRWSMPGQLNGTMPLMYSLKATKPA
ncbi:MAG: class I SAM-dependent methyltransferase [Actinobacteria bacterium]|nr:MAG: class I SAM-dependent methyltransferase [Actinomycetota bacterium]